MIVAGSRTAIVMVEGAANEEPEDVMLEALAFADAAAQESLARFASLAPPEGAPAWEEGEATESSEAVVITQNWDEIRRFMWNYVGIVRSDKRLARARRRIVLLREEISEYYWNFRVTPPLIELRNLATVASLVIDCARRRRESRGLHFTLDYPETSDEFLGPTILDPQQKTKSRARLASI